jgi:hypothetical protein
MDMQIRYEKLLADAAECAQLRDRATDAEKRELFGRLSEHLSTLASLMLRAMELQSASEAPPPPPNSMPTPPPAELAV